jgi:tricorn protease
MVLPSYRCWNTRWKTHLGGLAGIPGTPDLMHGATTPPSLAVWNPDGQFAAENRGIVPDVEVELDPEQVRQGKDPQLERLWK